jgi:hypothetical protein
MMRAVVAVICLASAGIIAAYTHYSGSGEPVSVYTVPARAPDPAPTPPVSAATARPIDPADRAALARALQRELKRVGCYQGEITSVWTPSSRMAMKAFNERVNATLPVDNPDPVLLSLVQGYRDQACSTACPTGQAPTEGGACLPAAVAAKAARTLPEARPDAERSGDARPAVAPAAAAPRTAASVALAAPAKADASKTDPKGPAPQSKPSTPGAARPVAVGPGASSDGPVPAEGMVRDGRPRRTAEAPASPPPKFVRDFLKALGF